MIHITDKKDCCGCNSCVQRCPKSCITMHEDEEGFLYPEVDESKCIHCGLCENVCPVIYKAEGRKPIAVYAAKNRNEEIRRQSSSGGVFTALAEEVIKEGGVVFGVRFNENWEVVHGYTESLDGLSAFRGSKYVQSRVGDSFLQVESFLKSGRKVLFSGTPCQVAGLHRFLRRRYENLLTVDFICHGVPSPGVWREYLKEETARQCGGKNTVLSHPIVKEGDVLIENISFRDKRLGWKKYSFALTLSVPIGHGEKNTVLLSESLNKNIFLRGFLANVFLRPSCYSCKLRNLKSGSELTIADCWGVENYMPAFYDKKGVSLILKFREIHFREMDLVFMKKNEIREAYKGNRALFYNPTCPQYRKVFFETLRSYGVYYSVNKYIKDSLYVKLKRLIRSLVYRLGFLKLKKYI